jgi:hypothetical protein
MLGQARGRRVVTVEAVHDQQALRVLVVLHHHNHTRTNQGSEASIQGQRPEA